MTSRTRFLITLAFACHLLLAPPIVTSQLLSSQTQQNGTQIPPTASNVLKQEDVTIRALEQEKQGAVYKLHGQAEIHYSNYILYADQVSYDSNSGQATADGHVVLDGGPNDEHIEATHGTYNIRAQTGRFEDVVGTTGIRFRGARTTLTTPNPFSFTGKVVEKTTPNHYAVYDGTITTCELPKPKWEFKASKVAVEVGANAKIYHAIFKVRGIPVLYLPYATHPVQPSPRQTGFLLPNIGRSSRKGYIVGESVFWAMNRTMDASIGAEYYSLRGWAQQGEFRARPSESSFVDLDYFGVLDRGIGTPPVSQGGENARLNAEAAFGHNFRVVANIDYLSSFVFRLAFNEVFSQAVYSEVKSLAFLSNTTNGFSSNASVQRYQNFESTTPGDVITILHAPSLEVSSVDRRILNSPVYWSYDASAEGLSRSEPGFRTATLVGRFDINPTLSLPLLLRGWSIRPQLGLRDTFYTQELQPSITTGQATNDPINRRALETSVEIRPPALDRVFDREAFGRKWKHVIEPRFVYNYTAGVANFANVLRFDDRDILSDTNEIEYGVINRLYGKRISNEPESCGTDGMSTLSIGGAPVQSRIPWERTDPKASTCNPGPRVREVVTWELAQKYFFDPTFGGALVPGRRNVFTTTADFTGTAFLTGPRRFSPLISRLRVETNARTDAEWDIDYDIPTHRITSSTGLVNYHIGEFTLGGGDAYLLAVGENLPTNPAPTPVSFNQFRLLLGYGHPNKRGFSAATTLGFDATQGFLQYSTVQTSYNWDCCGVSLEYRRFALGSVRNENQFRFTFALANVGAFGNLTRQQKLF
jgi:LPS-assembly protein